MQRKCKKILAPLCAALAVCSSLLFFSFWYLSVNLPSTISYTDSADLLVSGLFPVRTVISDKTNEAQLNLTGREKEYRADMMLFGVFPVGKATVTKVEESEVQVLGEPFGIKIYSDGVMVVGMSDVDSPEGNVNPSKNAGIEIGDVLVSINGIKVTTNGEVSSAVSDCGNSCVTVVLRRDEKEIKTSLTPAYSKSEKCYRIGLWVRDSSAGIGTLTFYDPTSGVTGGLGHGITDRTTGELVPLLSGELVGSEILGIKKSTNGNPGELQGRFVSGFSGDILLNSAIGVYGTTKSVYATDRLYPVALKQQVSAGYAQVLTTISDSGAELFDCMIEKICLKDNAGSQSMVIRITDERLLNTAGGIVQGMSGSPVIQNGRLVGAVTHVFVNDTARGYAVFAESMLNEARRAKSVNGKAS